MVSSFSQQSSLQLGHLAGGRDSARGQSDHVTSRGQVVMEDLEGRATSVCREADGQ